jgi:TPR repeat protein
MANNRTIRNLILAVVTLFLAIFVFAGCRTTEEPGHAEFAAGKAAYRAGDYKTAVDHFKLAAEQGNIDAQFWYAWHCYHGIGVRKDEKEAATWWRKAAEQGDAESQNRFGFCCLGGKGVEQDLEQAVDWFRRSAEQGFSAGQFSLGLCLYEGIGIEKDSSAAVDLWHKAAEQGLEDAKEHLEYFAEQGDTEARKALDELEKGE